MNLATVMDEIGTAVDTIATLRVYPYNVKRITPPGAIVAWPDITYDTTMGRGSDRYTLPLWIIVGMIDDRTARDTLAGYLAGSGSSSVKAAVDGGTYTTATVRVMNSRVQVVTIAALDFTAAIFEIDVYGNGA